MKTKKINIADIKTSPIKRGRKTKYSILHDLLPGEALDFGVLSKAEAAKIRCVCHRIRKSGLKIKTEVHSNGKFYVIR